MSNHPKAVAGVIAGAAAISGSATFVKLADTTAGTAAFYRCALALLVLVPLAWQEHRRVGARPARWLGLDILAGVLLGIDYSLWSASILQVGAAISTVLINVQIVVFPLLAWTISRQRPSGRFLATVPVMLLGVVLAAGVLQAGQVAGDPMLGFLLGSSAGVAYAAYLFLLRLGGGGRHIVYPVAVSTGSAAVTALILGGLFSGIDPTPGWSTLGWLTALALLGQVLAMLLLGTALPRLSPNLGATLLLLQPVLALALGVGVLQERPTLVQYAGSALVIAAVWFVSWRAGERSPTRRPPPDRRSQVLTRSRRFPSGSASSTGTSEPARSRTAARSSSSTTAPSPTVAAASSPSAPLDTAIATANRSAEMDNEGSTTVAAV